MVETTNPRRSTSDETLNRQKLSPCNAALALHFEPGVLNGWSRTIFSIDSLSLTWLMSSSFLMRGGRLFEPCWAALLWGAPQWLAPATGLALLLLALTIWSYVAVPGSHGVRWLAGSLKVLAIVLLILCLVEPLFSGVRPRAGANLFYLLVDNSRSLQIRDDVAGRSRGEAIRSELDASTPWQTRLAQDFDIRRYAFGTRLRPYDDFQTIDFSEDGSQLHTALRDLARRYQGRPQAGILLWTDGNATDFAEPLDTSLLPPIFPVRVGSNRSIKDVQIVRATVTQSNFEIAPTTVLVEARAQGMVGREIILQLIDEAGEPIQRQTLRCESDDKPLVHRFQFRPANPGVAFYRVRAFDAAMSPELFARPDQSEEATLVNNVRQFVVDPGTGPYRVLYVSGRPNWEFKFLRRAIEEDLEVSLVGLVRIAKREPKFAFRDNRETNANPLFRGFDKEKDEETTEYDQPVLLRLGTRDAAELRDGFPTSAEQLFEYHAIIVDDLEAGFFTQDQMSLIQQFVSQRGGGFLMLGGRQSFQGGEYQRTPIADLLPVYLDRVVVTPDNSFRFALTREGMLQPWMRLRMTEQEETKRLRQMPDFLTVNRVRTLKPGAIVLAEVAGSQDDPGEQTYPAWVVQSFGKGRSGAILIGDLWRWSLRNSLTNRETAENSGLPQAWRQTVRWLIADVPSRVEVRAKQDSPSGVIEFDVRVHDPLYQPLDNATVTVEVVDAPEQAGLKLTATASDEQVGVYTAALLPRAAGAYHCEVVALAPDGSEIGRDEVGWVAQPETEEFRLLRPHDAALERLARQTGGEVLEADQLEQFVSSLPNRKIPVTEPWVYPLWHQWSLFVLALGCLVGEWGLRRWKGLA